MESISDIFDALGGPTATGRLLGAKPSTASEMKRRGSIPVRYWPALIAGAAALNIRITADDLARLHEVRSNGVASTGDRLSPF